MEQKCSICREVGHNKRTCNATPETGLRPGEQSNKAAKKTTKTKSKRKRGGQPGNLNALKHGFYAPRFQEGEIEELEKLVDEIDLKSEINMMRVVGSRVMGKISSGATLEDIKTCALLLDRCAGRVGSLARLQQVITGKTDGLDNALHQALVEVAEELGIDNA